MKPLHRLAFVLGVAQVAVLAAAARRHGPHSHAGPARCGPGGPPPWMRERLAEWHREQHAGDDTPADSESA